MSESDGRVRGMHWSLRGAALACASAACLTAWTHSAAALAPGDDLPDGAGKKILQTACTACHDLGEVMKFKGYYTKPQWKDIVVTMVEYGAPVAETDVDVLADYLAANLGRKD